MSTFINSERYSLLKKIFLFIIGIGFFYFLSDEIASMGIIVILALISIPIGFAIMYKLWTDARFGIISCFYAAFLVNSIGRYIPLPFGLMLDGILIITWLVVIFSLRVSEWKPASNVMVLLTFMWFLYTFFEIFNPESRSSEAWFYAMRGISFYMMLIVPLIFLIYNKEKDFDLMILIWFVAGILSTMYGVKQLYIGLNNAEKLWLASGAAKQHILFGRLRVFSFYSDAGQFGAFMGYTGVVASILAFKESKTALRYFYIATAAVTFYGMAISGTRGALFVPLSGFVMYLVLSKNFKVLMMGAPVLAVVFYILKFTFIGQGNYQVQRMRSALNPDDPSFQARIENQIKFKEYLKTRPFGGGIGSAGFWGNRFSPGTFLAETPTDSHYVRIWAETGVVGLTIHLGSLIIALIIAFFRIQKVENLYARQKLIALFAGCVGIIVASYGNQVMSQNPTSVFFYTSLAFLFIGENWKSES